jgi:phosphonopyruvate decarboxylase
VIDPKEFYDALVKEGLDFFCGVPDSLLKDFCACVFDNAPEGRNIIAANEGGAVGMACGYHVATGKHGVVYMQNSGEGNAVNPFLSIADPEVYGIPMLLVIGWRGEPGVHDEPQHVKQGKVTLPLLEAMGIEYSVLDASWRTQLVRCCDALRKGRTVALVVRKGVFDSYAFAVDKGSAPLTRERALELALSAIDDDGFVVSTTGKTSREVFEIREARGQGHAQDFLTVGGMGHTASIAFGMARGTDRNVWCIDGDGSFLMHMGSLAVIARNAPGNFKYVLNNNGAHESVGGQPTVALQIDVPGVLRAFGFEVFEAQTEDEVAQGMASLERSRLGALVVTTRQGSRPDLGRPTASPQENKLAMMETFDSLEKLS